MLASSARRRSSGRRPYRMTRAAWVPAGPRRPPARADHPSDRRGRGDRSAGAARHRRPAPQGEVHRPSIVHPPEQRRCQPAGSGGVEGTGCQLEVESGQHATPRQQHCGRCEAVPSGMARLPDLVRGGRGEPAGDERAGDDPAPLSAARVASPVGADEQEWHGVEGSTQAVCRRPSAGQFVGAEAQQHRRIGQVGSHEPSARTRARDVRAPGRLLRSGPIGTRARTGAPGLRFGVGLRGLFGMAAGPTDEQQTSAQPGHVGIQGRPQGRVQVRLGGCDAAPRTVLLQSHDEVCSRSRAPRGERTGIPHPRARRVDDGHSGILA